MQITRIDIRPCLQSMRDSGWTFARAALPQIDGGVLALSDELGHTGLGYVHAIPAISGPGAANRAATEWLAAGLQGRTLADERGALIELIEEHERRLAFHASAKAAVDMALHDLLARRLGLPLHVLLGTQRRDVIAQSRIVPLKPPPEMADAAQAIVDQGYRQVKLKLSGEADLDVARVAAVRERVGPGVVLTLDANQAYDAERLLRAWPRLEPHRIALIEQPVPAADIAGLARLTRELDTAIEADESAQSLDDLRRLADAQAVDVVNLKITKLGGLHRFGEAVRLCESAGFVCRIGAAFGPALLQAFAAHAACVIGALPHACEMAEHLQMIDDPFEPLPVVDGNVAVPAGVGCGIGYAPGRVSGAG